MTEERKPKMNRDAIIEIGRMLQEKAALNIFKLFVEQLNSVDVHCPIVVMCLHGTQIEGNGKRLQVIAENNDLGKKLEVAVLDMARLMGAKTIEGIIEEWDHS